MKLGLTGGDPFPGFCVLYLWMRADFTGHFRLNEIAIHQPFDFSKNRCPIFRWLEHSLV